MSLPNRVRRQCLACGVEMFVWPCHIKSGRSKYCSWKCVGKGSNNQNVHTCPTCGTVFIMSPSRRTQPNSYCSMKCYNHKVPRKSMEQRILSNSTRAAIANSCWLWKGSTFPTGYGCISVTDTNGKRRNRQAHRVSWEVYHGPIPDGMFVCHKCDTPPCVNPNHLFLGTSQENTEDKVNKGRQSRGESHPSSKLSNEKVREIRKRHAAGETSASISRDFDVRPCTIDNVVHRRTWKHV